jgi:hypothetical protein
MKLSFKLTFLFPLSQLLQRKKVSSLSLFFISFPFLFTSFFPLALFPFQLWCINLCLTHLLFLFFTLLVVSSLKRRHDSLVKLPDVEFGTFPEIKIVQKKKPKIQIQKVEDKVKAQIERPPTPERARLVPELPIAVRKLFGLFCLSLLLRFVVVVFKKIDFII